MGWPIFIDFAGCNSNTTLRTAQVAITLFSNLKHGAACVSIITWVLITTGVIGGAAAGVAVTHICGGRNEVEIGAERVREEEEMV